MKILIDADFYDINGEIKKIKKDFDFYKLKKQCVDCDWFFEKIKEENKIREFMEFLENEFVNIPKFDEVYTLIKFNEYYIFEQLNITQN